MEAESILVLCTSSLSGMEVGHIKSVLEETAESLCTYASAPHERVPGKTLRSQEGDSTNTLSSSSSPSQPIAMATKCLGTWEGLGSCVYFCNHIMGFALCTMKYAYFAGVSLTSHNSPFFLCFSPIFCLIKHTFFLISLFFCVPIQGKWKHRSPHSSTQKDLYNGC